MLLESRKLILIQKRKEKKPEQKKKHWKINNKKIKFENDDCSHLSSSYAQV